MDIEQQLFSKESEEALIGSALINPGVMTELDITTADFYIGRHRSIWAAIDALHRGNVDIDLVTVTETLDRSGKLEEVGGMAALVGMLNQSPSSLSAEHYARIVSDYAARRRLVEAASMAAKAAYDLNARVDDSLPGIVDSVMGAVRVDGGAIHVSHFTRMLLEGVINKMENPSDLDGIPTGFIDFDKASMGLQPGEMLLWTGAPGVGKSISVMQAALQMAQAGTPVACYSMEMRGMAVVRRWVAGMSKVMVSEMRRGIDPEKLKPISEAIAKIDQCPLYIGDKSAISTSALRADLARLQNRYGIQAFVLDYDYLVSDGRGMSENDRTILISASLKHICRDRDMVGFVIHSMTKNAETLGADALRGSKQVLYDTDWLIVSRRDGMNPNVLINTIEKGRELETPNQAFTLIKLPNLPWVGNAERRPLNNGH